jgi:hypothetical protein
MRALLHLPESRRLNSQEKNNFPKTRFRFTQPSAIDSSERGNEAYETDGSKDTDIQSNSQTTRNQKRPAFDRKGAHCRFRLLNPKGAAFTPHKTSSSNYTKGSTPDD